MSDYYSIAELREKKNNIEFFRYKRTGIADLETKLDNFLELLNSISYTGSNQEEINYSIASAKYFVNKLKSM